MTKMIKNQTFIRERLVFMLKQLVTKVVYVRNKNNSKDLI